MIGRPDPDFGPMGRAVLGVALVYLLGAFSAWLYNYLMIFVSQGTLKNLRVKLFSKMERLPIKYFDTHAHGDIMSVYTNDIDTMRQMISQSMPQLISSVVTIVSIVTSMIILNVPLLIITLFMVATTMTLSVKRIKSARAVLRRPAAGSGQGQRLYRGDDGRPEGRQGLLPRGTEFRGLQAAQRFPPRERLQRQPHLQHHYAADDGDGQPELCALRGGRRPAGSGGYLGLTIGTLVSFLTLNKSFNQPINQVSQQSNAIIMALAGAERVFDLLDEAPGGRRRLCHPRQCEKGRKRRRHRKRRPHRPLGVEIHAQGHGRNRISRAEGRYRNGIRGFWLQRRQLVLHDIKLYATPGQKIAFVGSTGAGQTTITNLINRFYDIQDGKIRYDGININKIKEG